MGTRCLVKLSIEYICVCVNAALASVYWLSALQHRVVLILLLLLLRLLLLLLLNYLFIPFLNRSRLIS